MNVRRLLRTRPLPFRRPACGRPADRQRHSAAGVRFARQLGREPARVRTIRDPRDREHAGRAYRSGRDRPLDRAACEPGQRRPHRVLLPSTTFGDAWLAIPIVLALSTAVGLFNGFLVGVFRYQPVIATLGVLIALLGVNLKIMPTPLPNHRGLGRRDAGRSRPDPVGSDPDRASARRMGRAPADAVPPDALLRRRQCRDGVLRRCQRDIWSGYTPTRSAACLPASGGSH